MRPGHIRPSKCVSNGYGLFAFKKQVSGKFAYINLYFFYYFILCLQGV